MAARPYTVRAVQSSRDWKWRIRISSGNGKVVANGAQLYHTKGSAERAAQTMADTQLAFAKLPRENAK